MIQAAKTLPLTLVLEDLSLKPERVRTLGDPPATPHADGQHALLAAPADERDPESRRAGIVAFVEATTSENGALLLFLEGNREERELARWRDMLWPLLHVGAVYSLSNHGIVRRTLAGVQRLRGGSGLRGELLVARRRAHVLSPGATVEKFDQNAAGWNATAGKPGYAHFRWMRRYVAEFAGPAARQRILDFGCGAGWVGIEAALRSPEASLSFFDPSPEMVRHADGNARASGLMALAGRVGFGEAPPFPAAGEAPFDLVVCSGVISFSPDPERFLDGLVRSLAPAGTLVIGDLQRESRGMKARRVGRLLLPIRELNALTPAEVRPRLEQRGLSFEALRGYQCSWPMPQLMHFSETRLAGALDQPLVMLNRLAGRMLGSRAPAAFDSWVMRFTRWA